MSIAQHGHPRKEKAGGEAGKRRAGVSPFTPAELAELEAADAEIDDADAPLTPEERAAIASRDRAVKMEREAAVRAGSGEDPAALARRQAKRERNHRWYINNREKSRANAAKYRQRHREEIRQRSAAYNASHRQERRDYQKAYDAAHREQISARRKEKYAEKKRKEKEHGQ